MKLKSLQRAILLTTGLCTVLVILLSQSFYKAADVAVKKSDSKDKKDLPAGQAGVTIHAPSDVAAQGQSVQLSEEQQSALLEELTPSDDTNEFVVFVTKTTTNFFKTLFRAIISPNAP